MALVSARDAAKLAGKDRSTILRAIESGRMSGQKTERGYLIDPAEFERVFGTLRLLMRMHMHRRRLHMQGGACRRA